MIQSVAYNFQEASQMLQTVIHLSGLMQSSKKHIHQKQRKVKVLSESQILLHSTLYTDFAFEDLLQ